ncbi:hypothetical protein AB9K26_10305 [Psychroserpens sp. XS_ASV72]|uniref:hypothetical protein n=1 Tax=Psychroserpens sp. XS_ASV72 TaxID=3241293 RepID=UPI003514EB9B
MKIGSQIFSFFLILLLFYNSTRVTLTYTYYKLDPVGFIKNLCENVDQPELQCNGKCHLAKVSKQQNKEQKTPESILDFKELVLFINQEKPVAHLSYSNKNISTPNNYNNLYTFLSIQNFFHPPKWV